MNKDIHSLNQFSVIKQVTLMFLLFYAARSFNVTVDETPKSKEMGLKHKEACVMQITSSTVLIFLSANPPFSWPFNCIRRYKCHVGVFLIEVGRKASTGPGVFQFFTTEGQEIFEFLANSLSRRMSSKKEVKPDIMTSFAAMGMSSSDNQSNGGAKPNPFMDLTGAGPSDNIRFVMKKRSTSSPPPSPPASPRSPPLIQDSGGSYSHLQFGNEKTEDPLDEDDYSQLARAKQCNRHNKTRASESNTRHPSVSSNKALKVLGLIRSNSADNLHRTDSASESSENYAHLEHPRKLSQKSQSTSNILNEEFEGAHVRMRHDSEANKSQDEGDDSVYNRLHADGRNLKAVAAEDDNVYNMLHEASPGEISHNDTYDKLGSSQDAKNFRQMRPGPIIVDETYDALSFGSDPANFEPNNNNEKQQAAANSYEESRPSNPIVPRRPSESANGQKPPISDRSAGFPTPAPRSNPKVTAKPAVSRKPAPAKPPRKPGQAELPSQPKLQRVLSSEAAGEVREKVGGDDFRGNLISQLKKSFETSEASPPSSPLSPPFHSPKKLIEPCYAVSPFAGATKPQQIVNVPNQYDVPTNNAPKHPQAQSEAKQPSGFLYAVSPFHSGNKTESALPEQNLYDTPNPVMQPQCQYDNLNNISQVNDYDVPNPRAAAPAPVANLYDAPQNVRPSLPLPPKNNFVTPGKNMQFMYAVSPFAGGHGNPVQGRFGEGSGAPGGVAIEEPAYCEVDDVMKSASLKGYDAVGAVISSTGEPGVDSVYSVPRE